MTEWMLRHRFLAAAFALVLAQGLLRWWWTIDGYFWQDDFRYLAQARSGLDLDVLFQDYNGHLMPGSFTLARVVVAFDSSYAVALGMILLLQAIASLLLIWVVDLLFERRPVTLVLLAAAIFTPLTLVGVSWFAYGLQIWPVQIALLACLGSYIRWTRERGWGWLVVTNLAYLGGLYFWEKALLIPGVLVLFAVLVLGRGQPLGVRLRSMLSQWRLWVPMLVLTGAYLALFLSRITFGDTNGQDPVDVGTFVTNGVLSTLLPGLLGGPWTASGSIFTVGATPHLAATLAAGLVWLAYVVISVVRTRWRAAQSWLWVVAVVVVDYGLLVIFRPTAEVLARDSRYIADAIPIIAIGALAAVLPLRHEEQPEPTEPGRVHRRLAGLTERLPGEPALAAGAAAVVLIGAVFSTVQIRDTMQHTTSRLYVDTLKETVERDTRRVVLDAGAPFPAVFFGSVGELSAGMGLKPSFADAGQDMQMFDDAGQAREVTVKDIAFEQTGPREQCGWLLRPGEPVDLETGRKSFDWPHRILQVGYYGKQSPLVTITVDGTDRAELPASDGLGLLTVRTPSMPERVTLTVTEPGASVCITEVRIGNATPKTS